MNISLAIINDNAGPYLRRYLESLGTCGKAMDIIFVDNASRDDSVRQAKEFGIQKIIAFNTRQSSRAALYNAARDKADHALVLFTHSDIMFSEDFFEALQRSLLEMPDVVFMNFRTLYVDKTTPGHTGLHWDFENEPPCWYQFLWRIPPRTFANSQSCSTGCFLIDTSVPACARMHERYKTDIVVHAAMASLLLEGARIENNEKAAVEHYFIELHEEMRAWENDLHMFAESDDARSLDAKRKTALNDAERQPDSADATGAARPAYEAALRLISEDRIDEARAAFSEVIRQYPDHAPAHASLGHIYNLRGDIVRALMHLERAIGLDPLNSVALKHLADLYYVAMDRIEEARLLYCRIAAIDPHDLEALQIIANICVSLKQFRAAKVFYTKMLSQAPGNLDARFAADAIDTFLRAATTPEPPELRHQEAMIFVNAGLVDEAIAALEDLLKSHPEFALAHNDLGVLYGNKEDFQKAREHYEEAVKLDPQNSMYAKNLADVLFVAFGRVDEAIKMYSAILTVQPDEKDTLAALGQAYMQQNNTEQAAAILSRLLEIDPDNVAAAEALQFSHAGVGRLSS